MYIPTIGLEIHLQLATKSKMFCSCENQTENTAPNTAICPICTAQPGTLPAINETAVKMVISAGLALSCDILREVKFDRKNYFYPDLPKGYQISQYDMPICKNGFLKIGEKKISIQRIHLEEDTAKIIHASDAHSLIDFNRAGTPLMELVSGPDCESAAEARAFCTELQKIFRALGISSADMEKGQMRCEANISVRPKGEKKLGTKVEVKNINSFRAVEKSIEYEIKRQTETLEKGETIIQETRGWDDKKNQTISQRIKEEAHDYRYFPDPDLPPLSFTDEYIQSIQAELNELPDQKSARFGEEYGFSPEAAEFLSADKAMAEWTEHVMSEVRQWITDTQTDESFWEREKTVFAKLVFAWISSEIFKLLNEHKQSFSDIKITPENFAEFLVLIYEKKMNSSAGQTVLREMFSTGGDPSHIMSEKNLGQVDDETHLLLVVENVMQKFPEQAAQYQAGKISLLQFFIGKAMAETSGSGNPEILKKLFEEKLK